MKKTLVLRLYLIFRKHFKIILSLFKCGVEVLCRRVKQVGFGVFLSVLFYTSYFCLVNK